MSLHFSRNASRRVMIKKKKITQCSDLKMIQV